MPPFPIPEGVSGRTALWRDAEEIHINCVCYNKMRYILCLPPLCRDDEFMDTVGCYLGDLAIDKCIQILYNLIVSSYNTFKSVSPVLKGGHTGGNNEGIQSRHMETFCGCS